MGKKKVLLFFKNLLAMTEKSTMLGTLHILSHFILTRER